MNAPYQQKPASSAATVLGKAVVHAADRLGISHAL